jgi:hypothetical protein
MAKNIGILSFTANFENISFKFSKFQAYFVRKIFEFFTIRHFKKISRLQKDYTF